MTTARVEVLTAEVRTLQVGNRQVTLSIFRQLDHVEPDEIEPFGRVRDGRAEYGEDVEVHVVGRRRTTSELVRSSCRRLVGRQERVPTYEHYQGRFRHGEQGEDGRPLTAYESYLREHFVAGPHWAEWSALPLIVLAGLR